MYRRVVLLFAVLWAALIGAEAEVSVRGRGARLTQRIFHHAMTSFEAHADGHDELDPMACKGTDPYGGLNATAIDALDTLAVLGEAAAFHRTAARVCRTFSADKDVVVSVFETNIRIVGGLLGAHFALEEGLVHVDHPTVDAQQYPQFEEALEDEDGPSENDSSARPPVLGRYDGCLARLAVTVADRLLPAFDTATGLPYGSINLRHGVTPGEIQEVSVAGAGTFLLEFVALSALTDDGRYSAAAITAMRAVGSGRDGPGLVGNHMNLTTAEWTQRAAHLGACVDSYFEYLLKGYVMTGDQRWYAEWEEFRRGFADAAKRGRLHGEVDMRTGRLQLGAHHSLANFYPGVLALAGHLEEAERLAHEQHRIFLRYGAFPELFDLWTSRPSKGYDTFPLRPEHVESLYYLHRATGDPVYLEMGLEFATALEQRTRMACGYAGLNQVHSGWQGRNESEALRAEGRFAEATAVESAAAAEAEAKAADQRLESEALHRQIMAQFAQFNSGGAGPQIPTALPGATPESSPQPRFRFVSLPGGSLPIPSTAGEQADVLPLPSDEASPQEVVPEGKTNDDAASRRLSGAGPAVPVHPDEAPSASTEDSGSPDEEEEDDGGSDASESVDINAVLGAFMAAAKQNAAATAAPSSTEPQVALPQAAGPMPGSVPFVFQPNAAPPPPPPYYQRRMESFFLAETVKYLALLFAPDDHPFHLPRPGSRTPGTVNANASLGGTASWVFTTEGHIIPLRSEWADALSRHHGMDSAADWHSGDRTRGVFRSRDAFSEQHMMAAFPDHASADGIASVIAEDRHGRAQRRKGRQQSGTTRGGSSFVAGVPSGADVAAARAQKDAVPRADGQAFPWWIDSSDLAVAEHDGRCDPANQ